MLPNSPKHHIIQKSNILRIFNIKFKIPQKAIKYISRFEQFGYQWCEWIGPLSLKGHLSQMPNVFHTIIGAGAFSYTY